MADAGDVVWLDFPGAQGLKRRPAVVLSTTAYHAARPDMIIGLITSQIAKSNAPTDYVLADWSSAGLRIASAFRTYLATVPQSALTQTVGRLSSGDWNEVQSRIRLSLATE